MSFVRLNSSVRVLIYLPANILNSHCEAVRQTVVVATPRDEFCFKSLACYESTKLAKVWSNCREENIKNSELKMNEMNDRKSKINEDLDNEGSVIDK